METQNTPQGDCTPDWSIAFSGSKKWVVFDPDMNATYWYYAVTREPGDTTGFKFHGQFCHARYMAFNVYNDDTNDFVWGSDPTHRSSLSDVDIAPDAGSSNPYLLAVPRDTPDRDYTVWVVPEGSDTSGYSNVITFPQNLERISIFLRVYLPDRNLEGEPFYLSGGVPLPAIEDFDTRTGSPVACLPTRHILAPDENGDPDQNDDQDDPPNPGPNTDGKVRFYRLGGAGFYPNEDSAYLATIFDQIDDDTVAVIRVKPPTHTDTSDPAGILGAQTMVRYWSFNVYSIELTNVTACLADDQAVVAADGYVYLVLGRRPAIVEKAEGINFLPWGPHQKILFVYRNMFSNRYFPYSAAAVPLYSDQETRSAEEFIGDSAPIGVYSSDESLLKGSVASLFVRRSIP
jgi:hypothetical protein